MTDRSAFLAAIGDVPVLKDPLRVKQKSRDYFWYSPVLKRQLDDIVADAIVMPRNEADVLMVLKACYKHDVPLTTRGTGTGNYGQAMPVRGGIVLDISMMDELVWVKPGVCRVQAGKKIVELDDALAKHGQEVRMFPSTRRTATIGGFVAGGSGGIGSITWGMLRERGNIVAARIATMEEEPRIIELRGTDIPKISHSYGVTGIITELEMPLTTHQNWIDAVIVFDDFMDAARFGQELAEQPGILKKLCTVLASPIPQLYFKPLAGLVPDGRACAMVIIAEHSWEAFEILARERGAEIVYRKTEHEVEEERRVPIYEYTWNHTTLWALKVDPTITYLQTRFPVGKNIELVEHMYRHFGDEVPMHLEFVRDGKAFSCAALQLVRFTTEERLNEIMAYHEAHGCQQFNPHAYTLEEGGMKQVDQLQLDFKRQVDPKGLLNPGKMLAWEDPSWKPGGSKQLRASAG
ncbi:MAG TPA: FAD-binding oxidoreductase [Magnetospirillaceae bacterium]|jgi:FAD/FMN-containing dehydrogenase